MSWKIRHEGSPKLVEGLTLQQIVNGLLEGQWEVTDEVMAPGESKWTAIENHPQLAEIAADVEPRVEGHHEEETSLDMTALIDVCLVLLIFFILTVSISVLQSRIDAADVSQDEKGQLVVSEDKVDQTMIKSAAHMENGKPVITVEGKPVEEEAVELALRNYVRGTSKTILLLDVDPKVPHGTTVQILAAAKRAGIKKVARVVP